ncbi:hypothetical protein [Vibrio aphrogenes]|uniref:hypothetical protein n=1 Tax=Vibrio aphrogenes TaxID=1891186 RepID=UPI000B34AC39|nr:hypothetical protein [Vibrio aphrogenes]
MAQNAKRLRFIVWCIVILILCSTWLYVWKYKTEPEAERSAFVVAQRQILANANTYRQDWMLDKQPETSWLDGQKVTFSTNGWPLTLTQHQMNCEAWWLLLWPDKKIFGQDMKIQAIDPNPSTAHCEYLFIHGQRFTLQLVDQSLNVSFK